MPALTFDDPRVIAYLEQLAAAGFLDKEVFSAIGEALQISTTDRFEKSQTAPDGRPWAPLSPRYAAWKRKMEGIDRILAFRGDLGNNIRFQATDVSVAVGSASPYSAIHQFGGRFKAWGKHEATMPARPYLGVSDEDAEIIMEIIENAFARHQP